MKKTFSEMKDMQEELDDYRASLALFCRGIITQRLKYPEIESFLRVAGELIRLDEYRKNSAQRRPSNSSSLQRRQEQEPDLRREASDHLKKFATKAGNVGDFELARNCEKELQRLNSTPHKEKELYRARREWGREICNTAKRVFYAGANNQLHDVARSGGQSVRLLECARDPKYLKGAPPTLDLELARDAAIAEHFGAGNCLEQAFWVVTELNKLLPGTPIAVASWFHDAETNHAYSIIGRPNFPESAYVDTWTLKPAVTNWKKYGLQHTGKSSILFQTVASGRDLRNEAREWIHQLPNRPHQKPPITLEAARDYLRHAKLTRTKIITGAAIGYNSDSDSDDRLVSEFTLSEAAMMRSFNHGLQSSLPHSNRSANGSCIKTFPPGSVPGPTTRRR